MIQCKDCGTKWGDEAIVVPTCPLCGSPLRDKKIDFKTLTRGEVIEDEDPDAWMDKEPEPYVSDKPKKMKQSGRGLKTAYRDSILNDNPAR